MEIEHSIIRGEYAYTFSSSDKEAIAKGLYWYLKSIDKKIKKIQDNPNNEGQATYQYEIDCLNGEKVCLNKIIKEFTGN